MSLTRTKPITRELLRQRRREEFARHSDLLNLYVLFCHTTGTYKVGISRDVGHRIETIKQASPMPLTLDLVASIRCFRRLEKEAHEYLAAARVHGEWYRPSERLTKLISAMQDQRFEREHLMDHKDVFAYVRYSTRHHVWGLEDVRTQTKMRPRKTLEQLLKALEAWPQLTQSRRIA